jgi:TM2 domain-containing membrane protein YozV
MAMSEITQVKKCPYCSEWINVDARKCRHCGEIFDAELRAKSYQHSPSIIVQQRERKWSPGIAALLSFLIPGAGQIYKGNLVSGILWFIFTGIGYFLLVIPGLILHLICIFAAASGDPYKGG